jgi:hypothetical protein
MTLERTARLAVGFKETARLDVGFKETARFAVTLERTARLVGRPGERPAIEGIAETP